MRFYLWKIDLIMQEGIESFLRIAIGWILHFILLILLIGLNLILLLSIYWTDNASIILVLFGLFLWDILSNLYCFFFPQSVAKKKLSCTLNGSYRPLEMSMTLGSTQKQSQMLFGRRLVRLYCSSIVSAVSKWSIVSWPVVVAFESMVGLYVGEALFQIAL